MNGRLIPLEDLLADCRAAPYDGRVTALLKLAEAVSKFEPLIVSQYAKKVEYFDLSDADDFKKTVKSYQDKADTLPEKQSKPTDDELAQRWLEKYPNTKYGLGEFRRYEDGVYPAIDSHIIEAEIGQVLIEAKTEGIRPTYNRVKSLCGLAKAMIFIPDNQWDNNAEYLPVNNGLLHLPSLTLHEHDPNILYTSGLNYDFKPEADCPTFRQVLDTTIPQYEPFLKEFAGYCLTTDTSYEIAVWLYGLPGGGKSTILTGLMAMLGPRSMVLKIGDIELNRFALAKMPGKTLVVSFEQPGNRSLVTDTLNSIISGEPIPVDRKFRDAIEITPSAKLIWAMNELPRLKSANNGLLRRVKVIPVPSLKENIKDRTFKDKVKLEGPGILNWALDGLACLRTRGFFDIPRGVLEATNNFKEMVDIPALFISEQCESGSEYSEQSSTLYAAYRYWCDRNGYDCLTQTAIAEEWKRIGFEKYTSNGRSKWRGVKIKS